MIIQAALSANLRGWQYRRHIRLFCDGIWKKKITIAAVIAPQRQADGGDDIISASTAARSWTLAPDTMALRLHGLVSSSFQATGKAAGANSGRPQSFAAAGNQNSTDNAENRQHTPPDDNLEIDALYSRPWGRVKQTAKRDRWGVPIFPAGIHEPGRISRPGYRRRRSSARCGRPA